MSAPVVRPVPKALGVALIASPLLWLAAEAASPHLEADSSAQLAVIRQHPDGWYTYSVLLILGTMLFVPAIIALMMLAQGSRRLATVGGVLLGFGTLVAVGDAMSQLMIWQMVGSGADLHQMAALMDRFDNAAGNGAIFGLGGLCFLVGTVLLTIALIRSKATPVWADLLFGVGIVVQLVGFTVDNVAIIMISSVMLLAGMGGQALSVLALRAGRLEQARPRASVS